MIRKKEMLHPMLPIQPAKPEGSQPEPANAHPGRERFVVPLEDVIAALIIMTSLAALTFVILKWSN